MKRKVTLVVGGLTFAASLAAVGAIGPRKAATQTPVAVYRGFSAPESIIHDAASDRYLVSNVNGGPTAKDNNGFISILSPGGKVIDRRWIAGGKNNVKLDAPKGLAISEGVLYVADVSVVRTFDLKTGTPKGDIDVPGSTYLNDLAAGPDGKVYLSDSGPPTGRLDGVGTEAVYVIENGRARILAKGKELGRPNGLAWTDTGAIVCPFGANAIYRLDEHGRKHDVTQLPAGGLAGIAQFGDTFLITSWQSSSIYRGKLGGTFEVAFADQKGPADIGYDSKRSRLLVPHFTEDTVDVYSLK
jgi:hypothetical protein